MIDEDDTPRLTTDHTEPADYWVCPPYHFEHGLILPDNKLANCCECDCRVQHRPVEGPPGSKIICMFCMMANVEDGKQ